MKPTYGRVSRRGVLPLSYSLDHVGPMTRTVRDNALLLQVLAGHDPEDPGSADEAVPDYSADLERGVKGLKIGLIRHFYVEDMQAHPEQTKAMEEAAEVLRGLGAEVREDPAGATPGLCHLHAHHHPLRGVLHPQALDGGAAR
jgi:aspartyl-tRNA(Asn)/glutamyl-tRNA(Gln) amidotransferase subunit A